VATKRSGQSPRGGDPKARSFQPGIGTLGKRDHEARTGRPAPKRKRQAARPEVTPEQQADQLHQREVKTILALRDHMVVRVPVGVSTAFDGCEALLGGLPWSVQQIIADRIVREGEQGIVLREL
jgi:hypothetical protein